MNGRVSEICQPPDKQTIAVETKPSRNSLQSLLLLQISAKFKSVWVPEFQNVPTRSIN
eukprot:m.220509 g.220509  ORF g.220509 m.220509 type:complete len:58 (-) comp15116_c1_seq66:218-391(-)